MLKKLQNIAARYEELGGLLASPEVLADMDLWKKYSKERAELAEIAEKYGVDASAMTTKKEIIAAIDAAREELPTVGGAGDVVD